MQELAMEFSPEEDIQNLLAKSAAEAQPEAGNAILSHRAEKRVRRNTVCIIFSDGHLCGMIRKSSKKI
jgi:hypothetical protein